MDVFERLKEEWDGLNKMLDAYEEENWTMRVALKQLSEPFSGTGPDALGALQIALNEFERRIEIARAALKETE